MDVEKLLNLLIKNASSELTIDLGIASASMLTEIVIGKYIGELSQITNQDIVEAIEGLPNPKIHCSIMCKEVLEYAISNYKK